MKRMALLAVTLIIAVLALASFAVADVPQMMNYQAILEDSTGKPIRNDTATILFRIYNDSTGGSELWTETDTVDTDKNGAFSVLLGSAIPIPDSVFTSPDRWLGVTVRSDPEMSPRMRLASAPYAYHALRSDSAYTLGGQAPAYYLAWGNLTGVPAGFADGTDDDGPGDIEGVTAGSGLSGGGTSGSVTLDIATDGVTSTHITDGTIQQVDLGFTPTDNDWTISGSNMYSAVGGNVGIGTTNPGEKLSVAGTVESTSGGFKFPDGSIQTTATSVGGIAIITGSAAHNGLITPPPGYTVAQCKCIVSSREFGPSGSSQEAWRHWCYVTQEAGGWRVYARSQNAHYGGFDDDIANYMVIGVK